MNVFFHGKKIKLPAGTGSCGTSESRAQTCLLGFLNITDDGESLEPSDDDNKDHVDI